MQKLFENWRRYLNEDASSYREERETIYKSYERGANKGPWVDRTGLLRRKVFGQLTPQNIIDSYYDEIILPQLKNAIFNTPVESYSPGRWRKNPSYSGGVIRDPYDGTQMLFGGIGGEIFQHELGHAIDHQVRLYDAFIGKDYKIKPRNKFFGYLKKDLPPNSNPLSGQFTGKTLTGHQKDILNKIFSLPVGGGKNIPHCGRRHEIYTSIIMQRQQLGGAYTPEYIEEIDSFWGADRPDAINRDLFCAIKEYRKEGLSYKEIANLLNQIAKAEITKTSSTAE